MQFTITINQSKALEWGLNAQQALLYAFVYGCPSWATPVEREGETYYALSKAKIVEELPILTDKPDTAYRLLKALAAAGLIDLSSTSSITLVRLTEKGKEWNRKRDGSEKYPTKKAALKVGNKSDPRSEKSPTSPRKNIRSTSEINPSKVGKISVTGSEKSPTNQDTSNQDTNQDTSQYCEGGAKPLTPSPVDEVMPRVEIPEDMPGPKDPSCKTFKAWANYAMAYRKRYATWPMWNAKSAGQVGQLVSRLGIDVAHSVAAYYLTINDARMINDCHSLGILLAKAEAIHTQWVTGRQMNGRTARQLEDTQANLNAAQQAAVQIREKGTKRNAFL